MPAVDHGLDALALTQHEGTGALQAAELVRRDGVRVATDGSDRDRQPPGHLDAVDMEADAPPGQTLADLGNGLEHASLVVGMHHRHQQCLRAQGSLDLLRVYLTRGIDPDHAHLGTMDAAQPLAGLGDTGMLDGGQDQMPTPGLGAAEERPGDGQVGGLGATAGDHDVIRRRPQQRRHLGAGRVQRPPGLLPHGIGRRGIAVGIPQERRQRLGHLRMDRRGGIVVKIDRQGHAPRTATSRPRWPVPVSRPR